MSEKAYAWLLRLYPPAFRRLYEAETLQLLRDRLRDESGFLLRLRLGLDLITDLIRALPLAYRNSYAEAATPPFVPDRLAGVPSFQSLHNEPIPPGRLILAGTLAFTALFAFGYLMKLPIPFPTVQPKGNESPIESVLERLNNQALPESTETVRSDISASVPTTGSRTDNRKTSTRMRGKSSVAKFAQNRVGQSSESDKQISDARTFVHASLSSATTLPFPTAPSREIVQKDLTAVPIRAQALSSHRRTFAAIAASLSGQWVQVAGADGPRCFNFQQHSTVLVGSGGSNSSSQFPIIHGSVSGDSVRFELSDGRKDFLYDLEVEGEELRGTLLMTAGSDSQRATVRLRRTK